jgi:tRNA-Thr(GGU) m(6)t(6)A37 methyltransferase TsaA
MDQSTGRTPPALPHQPIGLEAIGWVRSPLRRPEEAPLQGFEGGPDAWIDLRPELAPGLRGVRAGDELLVVTWLHLASRQILEVHPRGDPANPLAGVFGTRSPHRPNPLGLHRVTVRAIAGASLQVGPLEAVDGTPVVDLKAVLPGRDP